MLHRWVLPASCRCRINLAWKPVSIPCLQELDEDGVEEAFELQAEIPEKIRTGIWVRALAPWQGLHHRRLDCHLSRLLAEQAAAPGCSPSTHVHPRPLHCRTSRRWATASSTTTRRGASTTAWAER